MEGETAADPCRDRDQQCRDTDQRRGLDDDGRRNSAATRMPQDTETSLRSAGDHRHSDTEFDSSSARAALAFCRSDPTFWPESRARPVESLQYLRAREEECRLLDRILQLEQARAAARAGASQSNPRPRRGSHARAHSQHSTTSLSQESVSNKGTSLSLNSGSHGPVKQVGVPDSQGSPTAHLLQSVSRKLQRLSRSEERIAGTPAPRKPAAGMEVDYQTRRMRTTMRCASTVRGFPPDHAFSVCDVKLKPYVITCKCRSTQADGDRRLAVLLYEIPLEEIVAVVTHRTEERRFRRAMKRRHCSAQEQQLAQNLRQKLFPNEFALCTSFSGFLKGRRFVFVARAVLAAYVHGYMLHACMHTKHTCACMHADRQTDRPTWV